MTLFITTGTEMIALAVLLTFLLTVSIVGAKIRKKWMADKSKRTLLYYDLSLLAVGVAALVGYLVVLFL